MVAPSCPFRPKQLYSGKGGEYFQGKHSPPVELGHHWLLESCLYPLAQFSWFLSISFLNWTCFAMRMPQNCKIRPFYIYFIFWYFIIVWSTHNIQKETVDGAPWKCLVLFIYLTMLMFPPLSNDGLGELLIPSFQVPQVSSLTPVW